MFTKHKKQNADQALHTEGNNVLDARGRAVRLLGVNTAPLVWMASDPTLPRTVEYACDTWRANVIRLPLSQDTWFGFHPDQTGRDENGEKYRREVDRIIDIVASRRKYVILDLHRTNCNTWGPYITGCMADMNSLVFWKDVATRYQNHPNVIFDLHNEPFQTTWDVWKNGGDVTIRYEKKDIGHQIMFGKPDGVKLHTLRYRVPGTQRMVRTVRGVGARNLIIIGGLDWSYELDGIVNGYAIDDCGGNGIMLDAHVYPCKPLDSWDKFVTVAADQYPIIIGECGHYGEAPVPHEWPQLEASATWVPRLLKWIDAHDYHLAAWDFHDRAGPCLVKDMTRFTPTPYWGAYVKKFLAKHHTQPRAKP